MEKAIAKRGTADALAMYREKGCNILTPVTQILGVPNGVAVALREVKIDKKTQAYQITREKFVLFGSALDKLAQVAGVSTVDVHRTDDRKHPHYSEHTATVSVVDFDGTRRIETATKVLDLRDDAGFNTSGPELDAMLRDAKKQAEKYNKSADITDRLTQARKFIHEICSSKAKNRAVRKLLGLQSNYTEAELAKPFVVPKIALDASDPDAKRAMLAGMSGSSDALFGDAPAPEKRVEAETKVLPPEPEKPDNAEAIALLTAAFRAGREGGIKTTELAEIAKELSGVERKEDITLEGAQKVADGIAIRIEELAQADGADDIPF